MEITPIIKTVKSVEGATISLNKEEYQNLLEWASKRDLPSIKPYEMGLRPLITHLRALLGYAT